MGENMTLDKVTSLFDLEQKAKANVYYKQLAMLGWALLSDYPMASFAGKEISAENFTYGMEGLIKFATKNGSRSCSHVVERINDCMTYLREVVTTPPPAPKPAKKSNYSYYNDYDCKYYTNSYTSWDDDF